MANSTDATMIDLEQELADSIADRRDSRGEPLPGLYNLTRRMDDETDEQFHVDLTIMDFLTYKATEAVFEWRAGPNPHHSDLPSALVTMTDEWRTLLKHRHTGRRLDDQVAFRSRLLQFALVFTHRFNHEQTWTTVGSLNELRARNKHRGQRWSQQDATLGRPFDQSNQFFPRSDGALAENRQNFANSLNLPKEKRRWITDLQGTPTLHCLLPLFIELTAARVQLGDWEPSEGWMELVGQFMLHAALEEYLLNGAYGQDTFNAIFAFGCPDFERHADDGSDIEAMRRVFCLGGRPHEQLSGWTDVRKRYIQELLPSPNSSIPLLQTMQSAQGRHSYIDFENQVLAFLKYLHDDLVKPDLVQVEEERITLHGRELSRNESREMIKRMRL